MLRTEHARDVLAVATLSEWQVDHRIPLPAVLSALRRDRVEFVLVGAHAIGGWTRKPRAIVDVDILVASRSHRRAVKAIRAAFPSLEVRDFEVATRFLDPATKEAVIDLMKPRDALIKAVFAHTVELEVAGEKVRIPDLEMAVAMKFAAMVGVHRAQPDKMQDAADFARMVAARPKLDLARLARFADLVYRGGSAEARRLAEDVRQGRTLVF